MHKTSSAETQNYSLPELPNYFTSKYENQERRITNAEREAYFSVMILLLYIQHSQLKNIL